MKNARINGLPADVTDILGPYSRIGQPKDVVLRVRRPSAALMKVLDSYSGTEQRMEWRIQTPELTTVDWAGYVLRTSALVESVEIQCRLTRAPVVESLRTL